jgi:PE family
VSLVTVSPELVATAAQNVGGIGAALQQAHAAAAPATASVVAAAGDEVSAAIAAVFSGHGQAFQAVSARAVNFLTGFEASLKNAASHYGAAELDNLTRLSDFEQRGIQPFTGAIPLSINDYIDELRRELNLRTGETTVQGYYQHALDFLIRNGLAKVTDGALQLDSRAIQVINEALRPYTSALGLPIVESVLHEITVPYGIKIIDAGVKAYDIANKVYDVGLNFVKRVRGY